MTVSDQNSVYVGGLAYDVSEELLRKEFEDFGEIVSIKIVLNQDGQPRGYAFITFASPEAANGAIDGMTGKVIAGRTIKVNEALNRGSNGNRDRERDRRDRQGRDRDRDRYGRGRRYSPLRRTYSRGRDRSPDYRRRRSSRNDRSRSSTSTDSLYSHDRNKSKPSKEIIADTRLKEDLVKVLGSQKSQREQVAILEDNLQRAFNSIEELQNKDKRLEAALVKTSAALFQQAEYLKRVQRAFFQVKECQERLRHAEVDFQELAGMSLDIPELTGALANGDLSHVDDSRKKLVETQ